MPWRLKNSGTSKQSFKMGTLCRFQPTNIWAFSFTSWTGLLDLVSNTLSRFHKALMNKQTSKQTAVVYLEHRKASLKIIATQLQKKPYCPDTAWEINASLWHPNIACQKSTPDAPALIQTHCPPQPVDMHPACMGYHFHNTALTGTLLKTAKRLLQPGCHKSTNARKDGKLRATSRPPWQWTEHQTTQESAKSHNLSWILSWPHRMELNGSVS